MNWKTLQAFHKLYTNEPIDNYIANQPYGKRYADAGFIYISKNKVFKTDSFDAFYEQKWKAEYEDIYSFLVRNELNETNFELEEIEALRNIEKEKDLILESEKSLKEISTDYFGSAKKVKKGTRLFNAILLVLAIDSLKDDEHDQQYLMVLHAANKNPCAIILCENDNLLRKPRLKDIELWHVGGNNTSKLAYINEPQLPFFYLCDWDNKGLEIFQRIKRNYFPRIQIIVPSEPIKYKRMKNDIKWTIDINLGLFPEATAKHILERLVERNEWIEEESIKLNINNL